MKLGLINSAWVQAGQGTAFGIRETRAIGFDVKGLTESPIKGAEGNVEFLMHATRALAIG